MKYSSLEVNISREGIARKNEARNIDSYETNDNCHRLASGGSLFDVEFCFHRYHFQEIWHLCAQLKNMDLNIAFVHHDYVLLQ